MNVLIVQDHYPAIARIIRNRFRIGHYLINRLILPNKIKFSAGIYIMPVQ